MLKFLLLKQFRYEAVADAVRYEAVTAAVADAIQVKLAYFMVDQAFAGR